VLVAADAVAATWHHDDPDQVVVHRSCPWRTSLAAEAPGFKTAYARKR